MLVIPANARVAISSAAIADVDEDLQSGVGGNDMRHDVICWVDNANDPDARQRNSIVRAASVGCTSFDPSEAPFLQRPRPTTGSFNTNPLAIQNRFKFCSSGNFLRGLSRLPGNQEFLPRKQKSALMVSDYTSFTSTRLFSCETGPGFIRNGFEHASPTGSRSQLQVISFHLIPSPGKNI